MENINFGMVVLIAFVVVPLFASMLFSNEDIKKLKQKNLKKREKN